MKIGAAKRTSLRVVALAIAAGEAAPTEFRIFAAGENATTKGTYLFDAKAARDVMAAYKAHGIDTMIDLEHLSCEDPKDSRNFDPDARGWCKLEVRNGELWAVAVSWTPDGLTRLNEKRQRYISPAFSFDPETGRISRLLNIAITALPATDHTEALVAASARGRDLRKLSAGVSFSDVQRAIGEALSELYPRDDADPSAGPYVNDVFDTTLIYELDGKIYEVSYTFDGSVAALGASPVEVKRTYTPATAPTTPTPITASRRQKLNLPQGESPMNPEQFAALAEALGLGADANVEDVIATVSAMVKKVQDAANGTPPPGKDAPKDAPQDPPLAANAPPAMVAAARMCTAAGVLARLSGKADIGEAVQEVEVWRTSHIELEKERTKLASERAALEGGERRRLVGELVKLGSEFPATAWADDTATKPAEPWASMPIAQLRDRVGKIAKAKGGTALRSVPNPASVPDETGGQAVKVGDETVQLSAREVATCKELGTKVEDYAANKLYRARAQGVRAV